jgi:hypothetical protein
MTKKTRPNPADQYRRFIETARLLECDEDKERFEEKLKRIATANQKSNHILPRTRPIGKQKPES